MSRLPAPSAPPFLQQSIGFVLLTMLFIPLNFMGTAIFELAGGLTTVKPYGGVSLALIQILRQRWLRPALATGTPGGMVAHLAFDGRQ